MIIITIIIIIVTIKSMSEPTVQSTPSKMDTFGTGSKCPS